jgi:pimeloyl-ACP methyl ester carboxylesterase
MSQKTNSLSADLRGAGKLTIDAITGITDIVESLHHAISPVSGIPGTGQQYRTRGITGFVYRSIRTITGVVGDGIDAGLNQLNSILGEMDSSPAREATLSALNGVLGDHLVARNNPLAIPMQFRRNGLPLDERALYEAIQQCNGKLAIMVHGSCMNDLQWNRKGHDHGAALARDLGILPVYVHYNTGLHISENGKSFAGLLETVFAQLPHPPELFIIGHSMGGLVSRSACHYGKISGHRWLDHLQKLIFLGTPHHGALLEKGGNWINILMDTNPYSSPFSRLGKTRSCGITDLRYGNVLDDDWNGRCRFEFSGDQRKPVSLPDGVQCYSIAACTGEEPGRLGNGLIGDGLVTLSSALGRHKNKELDLPFPANHQWIGREMNHMDLLNHPEVYATIGKWLKPRNPGVL